MMFPPPDPNTRHDAADTSMGDNPPPQPRHPSRRRTASVVALTSGLLVGGVLVGSGFASANTPTIGVDSPPAVETADDNHDIDPGPEVQAQFEAFDACLSEQLGDLDLLGGFEVVGDAEWLEVGPGFDVDELGDLEFPAGVFVEAGTDTGFYEFGEGDGAITISKVGDDLSVSTEGDVDLRTFDMDHLPAMPDLPAIEDVDFDAHWAELDDQWQQAEAACGDLLPGGVVIDIHQSERDAPEPVIVD